jgi:hypothetical protein
MPIQGQNIMTDGPGLKDRARETNAVLNNVTPLIAPEKPVRFEPTPAEKVNAKARFGSRSGEKRIDTSEMMKPLGSFAKGTSHVPKTSVYKLHEGEAVIPAKDNPMSNVYDKITEGMKKPKKVIDHIRTRKTEDGKYLHEHHHTRPDHHPVEHHVSNHQDAMVEHMMEHMGEPNPGEGEGLDKDTAAEEQEESVGGGQ